MKKQKVTFEQLWRKIGEESGLLGELQQQAEQAVRQKALETARNALSMGLSAEQAVQLTGLSPADIAAL